MQGYDIVKFQRRCTYRQYRESPLAHMDGPSLPYKYVCKGFVDVIVHEVHTYVLRTVDGRYRRRHSASGVKGR